MPTSAPVYIPRWRKTTEASKKLGNLHTEIVRQMTLRERLEGIAAMVTGITHDVSTPLGVACTAG